MGPRTGILGPLGYLSVRITADFVFLFHFLFSDFIFCLYYHFFLFVCCCIFFLYFDVSIFILWKWYYNIVCTVDDCR